MNIAVIGVNHHVAPIRIREAVSFTDSKKVVATNHLLDQGLIEVVILSTCNRSEIYFHDDEVEGNISLIKSFFCDFFQAPEIETYLFSKIGEDALWHLLNVAAGLDSVVLGEDQILGQVKSAHEFAQNIGSSKKLFNKLFRVAVETAKEVKNKTKISEQPLSISYIAVKYLKEKVATFEEQNIMIIGTGEMGRLALKYLSTENPQMIYLANRSASTGNELKKLYPEITTIAYEDRYQFLNKVDIVISATSAPHMVIRKESLPKIKRNLLLMDIALPRDIDPELGELENIQLYDIDVLKSIRDENVALRQELAETAQVIIKTRSKEFIKWLALAHVDATIKSLNHRCEEIKEDAVAFLEKKLTLTAKEKQLIDSVTAFALKRLIREPILHLKQTEDSGQREIYIEMTEKLFNIN